MHREAIHTAVNRVVAANATGSMRAGPSVTGWG